MHRLTRNGPSGLAILLALSIQSFAADYYVNDTNTVGDVWCATGGSVTNSGLSTNSPALRLQDVIDTYTLGTGDVVYIDTGLYQLSQNVTITSSDSGDAVGGRLTIRGTGDGTVLDRGTTGGNAYGIHLHGAQYVQVRDLRITTAAQGLRVENAAHTEIQDCRADHCKLGVVVAGGSDNDIRDCGIDNNEEQGILGSSCDALTVSGNTIHDNTGVSNNDRGIDLFSCGSAAISGNTVFNNGYYGIRLSSCASPNLSGNTVHSNGDYGIHLHSCSSGTLTENNVHQNPNGVYAYNCPSLSLSENRIHANAGLGVHVQNAAFVARHNLFYANGTIGLDTKSPGAATVENNTFYLNGTVGLKLWDNYESAAILNNVFAASGSAQRCIQVEDLGVTWYSDYNDFHATGGAFVWDWMGGRYGLGSWQHYCDHDRHSLDIDPRFVDPDGADGILGGAGAADDDFHLQSTAGSYHGGAWSADGDHSICIDAGDPDTAFASEPAGNGSRVNLGAYGGTAQASKSTGDRIISVLHPAGGEIGFRRFRVRWACTGPWETNDQIKVEYSPDNGGNWFECLNANPLDFDNGLYGWDISGFTPGNQYLIRVTYLSDGGVTDVSDSVFEILDANPKTLYVNDGSTASDEWCTAPGSLTNTALTPASPVESFQSIVDKYPEIGSGDEIRIDSGT